MAGSVVPWVGRPALPAIAPSKPRSDKNVSPSALTYPLPPALMAKTTGAALSKRRGSSDSSPYEFSDELPCTRDRLECIEDPFCPKRRRKTRCDRDYRRNGKGCAVVSRCQFSCHGWGAVIKL